MTAHIRFCTVCNIYTMIDKCPKCSKPTILPRPPKYSPEDKYSKYRRMAKLELWQKEGLA